MVHEAAPMLEPAAAARPHQHILRTEPEVASRHWRRRLRRDLFPSASMGGGSTQPMSRS
jgi:hypothetical protein